MKKIKNRALSKRTLGANPEDIPALKKQAHTLSSQNRHLDALKYLVQAVILQPQDAQLLCDLADTWQAAGHFPQAIAAYQKALELAPDLLRTLYSLGCAQIATKEYGPAIDCFQRVIAIQPDWLEARHNLASALYEMGQVSAAYTHFQQCAEVKQRKESEHARAMVAVIAPGVPELDNLGILKARCSWAERDLPMPDRSNFSVRAEQSNRLRIGYVSSFFHGDNWMKPVWGLINQHDRQQFEIHLFSDSRAVPSSCVSDSYCPQLEDRFYDVAGLSNEEAAQLIHQCAIDILVDLNGYSRVQRLPLLAKRPAPLIFGWFNTYGTTGISAYDYLIGDHHVVPAEEEQFYSEKIIRVSGSWLTFEPLDKAPDIVGPPCLAGRGVTFGSAASQYKLTNEVVSIWSRILAQSPSSSLILKNKHLGSATSREFVYTLFEKNGISTDRVQLEGPEEYFRFLHFYDRIDVALETFPYGGATTTTDAVWQGVPVIASEGDRWASRLSVSILQEAGLGEFVARNLDEYVTLASHLATSPETPERLTELRRNMRSRLRSSSVCNTKVFAREVEQVYNECWRKRLARNT